MLEKSETTTLVKIRPEDNPHILALAKEAEGLRAYALVRVVANDDDLEPATNDLSIIANLKKALAEAKAEYVKPIKAHLEDINAAFVKVTSPLVEADLLTREKILSYREAQAKRQAEAEEINRQKAELAQREALFSGTGEITLDTTPVEAPAPVQKVHTDMGMVGVVRNLTWELADFKLVPDEFKILDSGKITKLVKAGGSIPGICIKVEETLRVTTRK